MGLVVGKLTTLPWLAQLAKARKLLFPHKISFGMLALFSAGLVLCIVCGVIVGDVPVIAANSLTLIFVVLILALKLRYCLT